MRLGLGLGIGLGGGFVPAWKPSQLAGYLADFDPNAGVNSTTVGPNVFVNSWTDKVGGFVGSNTLTARPTLIVGGSKSGNNPSVRFAAASSQGLLNTTQNIIAAGATRTVYALVKSDASLAGGIILNFRSGSRDGAAAFDVVGANTIVYQDSGNNDSVVGHIIANAWQVLTWVYVSGSIVAFYLNGVLQTSAGGSTNLVSDAGATGFSIGARYNAGQYWPGDMGRIVVCSGVSSAGDMAQAVTYLNSL